MRRLSVFLTVAVVVAGVWLTGPDRSEAGEVSISLGVGFVVGGARFRVAYGHGGYVPYYYRLETPLYYPGYDCTTYCYVGRGHQYHAPFCPVVRYHFNRHRYEGPYYGYSRSYGYGQRPYYHHRYDHRRYDHRRYDKRHHHRGYDRHYGDRGRHGYDARGHDRGSSKHYRGSKGHGKSRAYGDRGGRRDTGRSRDPGKARSTRPPRR